MAGESKNKYDAFTWIKKVIAGSITIQHWGAGNKLIANFLTQYGKEKGAFDMWMDLRRYHRNHFSTIIINEKENICNE